jgi:signal transduction histidine kinase/DNA-binding response OmpR family regulator
MPQPGKNSLSYHNVHALCFDDDEHLWIGTYSRGLNILNIRTGFFKHYMRSDSKDSLDDNGVYSIFKDKDNNMWVGTMTGLNIYDRRADGFRLIRDLGVTTIDIKQDKDGFIWFATFGKGLIRYNPDNGLWNTYLVKPPNTKIMGNHVNSICIDSDNQMWVGTESGLCKYNKEADSLMLYQLDIPSNNVQCVISDNHLLWLTTSNGMACYSPETGNLKLFTTIDGLQSNSFMVSSGLKASNGKIYFGSINGFNAFYPYRIKLNNYVPPVMITRLDISNKEVPVSEDGPLKEAVSYCPDIDLTYRDDVVTIHYAALSYCSPEQNMYAYKLEGFDREWNYVGKQNRVTYTSLPAVDYVFHIKGSNNDGLWNETGTSINITIHPPLYLTLPFKILYYLLALFTILGTIRFFVKNAEKRHKQKIQTINQEKEVELHNAKINFFTNIAHEIRTPVSLILAPLEKIMSSGDPVPEPIRENIDIIDRNSKRLLFLVNHLLDFRKIEQNGEENMCFTSRNIYKLLIDVKERFDPAMIQSGIDFIFNCPVTDLTAMVHYESIIKLVSNLLTNANKFAKSRVELSCVLLSEGHDFRICVSDDGCGIKEEEKELIFKPFYQSQQHIGGTGIGLSIVLKIVQSHKGTIDVISEPGNGSKFVVTLPVKQKETFTEGISGTKQSQDGLPRDILSGVSLQDPAKNKPMMLIVEDNEQMLDFLADSFSDEYRILKANDGQQALHLLKDHSVSIVISDWMMPNMDGEELCKKLRNNTHTSHIPFILLTAKTGDEARVDSMNCGADAHIEKPFSVRYLKACIRNLRELRNMLMEKYSKMPLVPISSIANNSNEEHFLNRMNGIIEQNFSNPELSVDFLARELCVSRSGLFAKIKSLTEATPNELIQIVRLKKAAVLLLENKYTVSEICYMVGFNNPSYFAKCFQKQFGINPGEFARSQK